jgi:hypothetical protein
MAVQPSQRLQDALTRFATHIHHAGLQRYPNQNYVASPLGAWLLLAEAAGANLQDMGHEQRKTLEQLLGMKLEQAFDVANELLTRAPAALTAGSRLWFDVGNPDLKHEWAWELRDRSATEVQEGLPTQAQINAWVNELSGGIIEEFPVNVEADVLLILANVIAADLKWSRVYQARELPNSWSVAKVLELTEAEALLIEIDQRVYAVHHAQGKGMDVVSVIAEDPDEPLESVLNLAERIAAGELHRLHQPREGSNIYTVREVEAYDDSYIVRLPAWEAESEFKLPGANYLRDSILNESAHEIVALQKTRAAYNAEGFKAASLSYMIVATGAAFTPTVGKMHEYTINFNHPYAVAATYNGEEGTDSLWYGLPVFSAIVRDAVEAVEPSMTDIEFEDERDEEENALATLRALLQMERAA